MLCGSLNRASKYCVCCYKVDASDAYIVRDFFAMSYLSAVISAVLCTISGSDGVSSTVSTIAQTATAEERRRKLRRRRMPYALCPMPPTALTTSPAMMSPATGGTNEMLAGVRRRMSGSSSE